MRKRIEHIMTPILRSAVRRIPLLSLTLVSLTLAAAVTAEAETAAPPNAVVYFINLKDGDAVKSPFKIQFGLSGMGVAPAGVEKANTGHHHLLIDTALTPEQAKEPIPADDHHVHFGDGQKPKRRSHFRRAVTRCNSCSAIGRTFRSIRRSCRQ
jgi:Domain of unknown function (DUF4399)